MLDNWTNFFKTSKLHNASSTHDNHVQRIYVNTGEDLLTKQEITASKVITPFKDTKLNSATNKTITYNFGKPNGKIHHRVNGKKLNILIFKKIISGFRTKIFVHFYKQELFCISYVYRLLGDSDVDKVLE